MGQAAKLSKAERNVLLKRGYRPIEIWVPDTSNPAYRAEAVRQAEEAASTDLDDGVMDWIEAVSASDWDKL